MSAYLSGAYLSGVWDVLHAGHIALLDRASRWSGTIVVGVLKDSEANERPGKKPLQDEQTRLAAVRALPMVSHAFLYHTYHTEEHGQFSPEIAATHQQFRFDLLIHGSDFIPTEYMGMDLPILLLPYTKGISSTLIRERILEGAAT